MKIGHPKRKQSSSNHPFSGAILVSGRVYVPWSKVAILGMVIPPFSRNPYNGYINPYYWVDDHPLLYGNNGSLDPGTYVLYIPGGFLAGFLNHQQYQLSLPLKSPANQDGPVHQHATTHPEKTKHLKKRSKTQAQLVKLNNKFKSSKKHRKKKHHVINH